jgi:hypothetical protein
MTKQANNHKVVSYKLVNDELKTVFGEVSFNGKFTFELDSKIDPDVWSQIGIIPLKENTRKVEVSNDLFYYLNSRLPKRLRKASVEEKLEYIDKTGLRVASDSFRLKAS